VFTMPQGGPLREVKFLERYVRECPWLTVADQWRRARNGTEMARPVKNDLGSGLAATAPAPAVGEARPRRHEPRWQAS
jgi:hypothetical protein